MKKTALLFFVLIFIGCNSEYKNEINIDSEKSAILNVMKTQQNGWNEGNWSKYMSGYKKTNDIRFVGSRGVTFGYNIVLENYKKGYPDKSAMGILTFSDQDIIILSETSAMVFGKWHLKRKNDEPWGFYTLLWEKTKGQWKIIHDHSSDGTD